MLKELLAVLKGESPLQGAAKNFDIMLGSAVEIVLKGSEAYWSRGMSPDARTALYKTDVRVNKLERVIRKQIVSHLSVSSSVDVPYCLTLMSLVKDVERMGDYAKSLAETSEFDGDPLPTGDLKDELSAIRQSVENLVRETPGILQNSEQDRAEELTREGRNVASRCETMVRNLAKAELPAHTVVTMTLGVRYYKRVQGHTLNLLSSVIMPLHKLDYFDENVLPTADGT